MRILVTGSSGFFGSWLVPALEAQGHEVEPYDIKEGRDIFDAATLSEALMGCEAMIHLAAIPHYDKALPAQEYTRLNIIGAVRAFDAFLASKARAFVYASSGAVYGFGQDRLTGGWVTPPIRETQYPTTEQWGMLDIYSASKLATEWLVARLLGRKRRAVTALRINCIEPHHRGAKDGDAHWGWWCSEALAVCIFTAAVQRQDNGYLVVNVGEPNPNLDDRAMERLLG